MESRTSPRRWRSTKRTSRPTECAASEHGTEPGMTIDGETRITGLIGDPVAHSRSPAILNAAYREAGLNWIYAAFPVPRGSGGDAVRGAARARASPASTSPCRTRPTPRPRATSSRPTRSALGAINVVTITDDGRLLGSSTDGEGFVRSVRDEGVRPRRHRRARRRRRRRGAGHRARTGRCGCARSPSARAGSTRPNRRRRWCPADTR